MVLTAETFREKESTKILQRVPNEKFVYHNYITLNIKK